MSIKIHDLQISLQNNRANLQMVGPNNCVIGLTNFPFNPEGDQTESELRRLALEQAKAILIEAAEAL